MFIIEFKFNFKVCRVSVRACTCVPFEYDTLYLSPTWQTLLRWFFIFILNVSFDSAVCFLGGLITKQQLCNLMQLTRTNFLFVHFPLVACPNRVFR